MERWEAKSAIADDDDADDDDADDDDADDDDADDDIVELICGRHVRTR